MPKVAVRHRFLHAFCINPSIRFGAQSKNEKVILRLRTHPVTQVSWIFTSFILSLIPLLLSLFLKDYLSTKQIIFINLFWYTVLFSFIFLRILNWLFNVGIITNQRIIDVDLHGILYKEVTIVGFSKIEDLTVKSSGFISSLFNYGNLFVQTAGKEQNVEFINIPDPTEAAVIIHHVIDTSPHGH